MSKTIKLTKGFDINLAGKAERKIGESPQPETFAIKPTDFLAITRPKLLVKEGDNVKAGTPLFYDKFSPEILYVAPVSGEIAEIVRGEKRKILEIRILADKEIENEQYDARSISEISNLSKEEVQKEMLKSGVWPNLMQRPFGIVANPADTPKSIFVSTFDTHPLAPEYDFIFQGQEQNFQAGINILSRFTTGKINVNIDNKGEVAPIFAHISNADVNKFSGKHPAGNVGVQIHHIDPVNKGEIVWTINPFGVIQIGKLFLNGKYDASKIIAVVGSEVKAPQYFRTYIGASISKFIQDNLNSNHSRFISGNVLTGERISNDGYIGYYDHQVTVIPEGDYHEFLGWIKPTTKKLSVHRAIGLLSFLNGGNKEYVLDSNSRGEPRAFVETGVFESVTPMDILPTYLIKSIMAEDYDDMESLGLLEVIEEDLALCEFVDVSKHDIQSIVRKGLELLRTS
ncbi:MAG: Na(+)-translocating NADH-quinone reductase subunit A [Bacteroidetes bacterium]|nr:Na(+)-translocating NADH-quinone reductase subunit A [Bacteroidota bacterium]MDA1121216.1 Na(+)-translocating NADH-quinone reductase subunit A [Bacteroidota bacterium]